MEVAKSWSLQRAVGAAAAAAASARSGEGQPSSGERGAAGARAERAPTRTLRRPQAAQHRRGHGTPAPMLRGGHHPPGVPRCQPAQRPGAAGHAPGGGDLRALRVLLQVRAEGGPAVHAQDRGHLDAGGTGFGRLPATFLQLVAEATLLCRSPPSLLSHPNSEVCRGVARNRIFTI